MQYRLPDMGSKFCPLTADINDHFWGFIVGKSTEKQGIKTTFIWVSKILLFYLQSLSCNKNADCNWFMSTVTKL